MNKIAILICASIYNQKGLFNAAHERAKHLVNISDTQIDLYLISTYKSGIARILSNESQKERPETFIKDGLTYKIIWIKNTIIDFLLAHKFKKNRICSLLDFKKYLTIFRDYNLIIGHTAGPFVWQIHKEYNIPYTITWHGSDIHTSPFLSKDFFDETQKLIKGAAYNIFVSRALLETSNKITSEGHKSVLYNGRDIDFVCYPEAKKTELKSRHSVANKRIVAFVGNLHPVKNIKSLPDIFKSIYEREKNIEFWILGDGPLKESLRISTIDLPIRFWGNIQHENMVDFMNMMDVLVLPSINEGLPLVTVEAQSCGCYVVGSRVGGIPESIGIENTVSLDDYNFARKLADRAIYLMTEKPLITVDNCFDWDATAQQENQIIKSILVR